MFNSSRRTKPSKVQLSIIDTFSQRLAEARITTDKSVLLPSPSHILGLPRPCPFTKEQMNAKCTRCPEERAEER